MGIDTEHPSQTRRALVLGTGITLLGVLRTLSDLGIQVIVPPDADAPARRSRWFRPGPPFLKGLRPERLAEVLRKLPRHTVLIPCSDQWARAIAALPADLKADYPSSVAPLEAIDVLIDKDRFRETLEHLDLPHPTTRTVASRADLDLLPDHVFQSSFLKPAHSQQFFARFGTKAFRISNKTEAIRQLTVAQDFEMMLQEYIVGPASNHYYIEGFVDREGTVRAMFARRRLRMSPPDFGNSTLMVSVPLEDVGTGAATLEKLFAHLNYRGVFSAEFKRDERDGAFKLIEVNARPWWYVEFAARCGVNVCELLLRDALGEPVDTVASYKIGKRCVFPYYDLAAARVDYEAGKLGVIGLARSWIGAYQPVFRWSDPAPAFGEVASLFTRRIRRMANSHVGFGAVSKEAKAIT